LRISDAKQISNFVIVTIVYCIERYGCLSILWLGNNLLCTSTVWWLVICKRWDVRLYLYHRRYVWDINASLGKIIFQYTNYPELARTSYDVSIVLKEMVVFLFCGLAVISCARLRFGASYLCMSVSWLGQDQKSGRIKGKQCILKNLAIHFS
jgi:hypothetical protein